ncbi:MAG: hypothetical protein ACYC0Z_16390 [Acidobacteriaceae bacterium]
MTNAEKLHTLKEHQAWRMGADGAPPLGGDISAAIEYAIQCCEAKHRVEEEVLKRAQDKLWNISLSDIIALTQERK